jgi:hypothetical protein
MNGVGLLQSALDRKIHTIDSSSMTSSSPTGARAPLTVLWRREAVHCTRTLEMELRCSLPHPLPRMATPSFSEAVPK